MGGDIDAPRFRKAEYEEKAFADIVAKTPEDFVRWARTCVFSKQKKAVAFVKEIEGKVYIHTREPYSGVRVACGVNGGPLLRDVASFFAIRGVKKEGGE